MPECCAAGAAPVVLDPVLIARERGAGCAARESSFDGARPRWRATQRSAFKQHVIHKSMRRDSARVWAIVGAIALPLAALLGLEHLAGLEPLAPATPAPALVRADMSPIRSEPALLASSPVPVAPRDASGTYRCAQQGRVIYTDKPERDCAAGTEVRPVNAAPASAGIVPAKPYQQQLAELEQTQAAQVARSVASVAAPPPQPARAALCEALWADIQRIDSLLRQPHSPAMGDYWTRERRQLSDRRHAERC